MKTVPLLLVLALGLSGCDAAKEQGANVTKNSDRAPMTLVFKSGYKMLVDGQEVPIFGKDECPPANTNVMTSIFGPDPDDGQRTCVVIAPDTKTVSVSVGLSEGPADETWTVERSGGRTMLRRADGSYLAAAK
ncbi:hypothetical protein [Pseudomonas cannabina]|uniref:hypothetical protein n=1 Tax=Pseudomonas cannabina TaxID=86840 RepID=UPI0011C3D0FD|nr:hypothetical protein [Pseudomonas cannabina]